MFDIDILGAYGHIHTKYKVSMSNPVARRCTQMLTLPMVMQTPMTMTTHDGQSMIPQGFLVDKPKGPKRHLSLLEMNFLH